MPGFDDNPYLLRRLPTELAPPPGPPRGHHPGIRWGVLVLLLALVAAGFGANRLLHPSAHRSPTAVALAFYRALAEQKVSAVAALVEPTQAQAVPAAMTAPVVQAFIRSSLRGVVVQPGTVEPGSLLTDVVLQTCQANLSCEPILPVPTTRVGSSWDVDWVAWQQSLTPTAS